MPDNTTSTTPAFGTTVGLLYVSWALDMLNELAYAVSLDFANRPQQYVDEAIPDSVADFRVAYGTDRHFQNTAQRQAMMLPLLGRSDGLKPDAGAAASAFYQGRKKFFDACTAFAERAVDTGVDALEQRVRSALVTFQTPLNMLNGRSFRLTSKLLGKMFEQSVAVLRSRGVAKTFGQDPPGDDWPVAPATFEAISDANGAKVVEGVGMLSGIPADYRLSSARFILLQKVAQEGGKALPVILSTDSVNAESDVLAKVIAQGYAWATSLRDFQGA